MLKRNASSVKIPTGRMIESNLIQYGNTLIVNLECTWKVDSCGHKTYNNEISKLYDIGNVTFEMRFVFVTTSQSFFNSDTKRSNIYLVRFNKPDEDNTTYNIIFKSPTFGITKQLIPDNIWHMIAEKNDENGVFNLNIEIKVETNVTRNPLFKSLHDDEQLTDFQLRGEDGVVPIHSAVLASFSPAFKAMLEKNWKETQNRCLQIPDVSKETLQHLKDNMYLDKLPDTDGDDKLLLLASCYMMEDLERRCKESLIKKLLPTKAIELSKFALNNNMNDLYIEFLKCIRCDYVKIKDIVESITE